MRGWKVHWCLGQFDGRSRAELDSKLEPASNEEVSFTVAEAMKKGV